MRTGLDILSRVPNSIEVPKERAPFIERIQLIIGIPLVLALIIGEFYILAPILVPLLDSGKEIILITLLLLTPIPFAMWGIIRLCPLRMGLPNGYPLQPERIERRVRIAKIIQYPSLILWILLSGIILILFGISDGVPLFLASSSNGIILYIVFGEMTEGIAYCHSCKESRYFIRRFSGWRCGACGWKWEPE
jgi:hypothetical protein